MDEFVKRKTMLQFVLDACHECRDSCEEFDGIYADCNQCMLNGIERKLLDVPAADVVARDCYERILAENDVMREQLAKIGKRPGNSMSDIGRIETATVENVGKDEYWGYWYRCSSCGNDNTEGSVYCSNCGRKLVY